MTVTINGTTGVTTPEVVLDNSAADGGQVVLKSSGYSNWNWDNYSGRLRAYYNATEYFTIDSSGNVGIGTSSPAAVLHVNTTGAISNIRSQTNTTAAYVQAQYTNGGTTVNTQIISDSGAGYLETSTNNVLILRTNSSERARIDTSGNVLVGTTSALGKLASSASSGAVIALDASSTNDALMNWTSGGVTKAQTYWQNANNRYYVAVGGTGGVYLASGGTSWTSASDERVKDIIQPIENAALKLSSWRTVIGKYKSDSENTRRSFLIAQDVLQTFPEAVDTSDQNELGVRYQDTIPLLVKAIQEQQTMIEQLKADVKALKGQLT